MKIVFILDFNKTHQTTSFPRLKMSIYQQKEKVNSGSSETQEGWDKQAFSTEQTGCSYSLPAKLHTV